MPDHGNCHTKPCRSLRCPAETLKSKEESGNRVQSHDEAAAARMTEAKETPDG